jgi:DNA polymerase III subunit delta
MTVDAYLAGLGKTPPAPVYLFCPGKAPRGRDLTFEPFLAEQAIERTLAAFVDPATRDMAYAAFYADETPAEAIVMEAQTFPFLAERRVILVRGADRYMLAETAARPMLAYLQAPNDMTVLIMLAAKLDKRTKFWKACEKNAVVVECPQLSPREVERWVREQLAARGKNIAEDAVAEIVQRAGTHLSDVNNALTVVQGYVGERDTINTADVIAACADVAEEEIWSLTDAIARSDGQKALSSLRRLMDLNKHPDEIMGIINWLLNSAYAVASRHGKSVSVSPFVAEKVTPLAERLGVKRIRGAFALCTETHFMMRSTGVDAALALELLVIKLANPMSRSQSA